MVIMAVDYGLARTGVAVCDPGELLASPVGTVAEKDEGRLISRIAELAREHGARHMVVGLPRNMDGSLGESARRAQAFAGRLEEATGLSVSLWDERLTTVSAHAALNATNTRGKKRKQVVDTVSAVMILEDYLRSQHLTGKEDER